MDPSFLSRPDGTLILDSWGLPNIKLQGDPPSGSECTFPKKLPYGLDALSDVIKAERKSEDQITDRNRTMVARYASAEKNDEIDAIPCLAIRMQGVATDFSLGEEGTFNKKGSKDKADAKDKAHQYIELADLGTTDAWKEQADTIDTIRWMLHREVSGRPTSPDSRIRSKYYIARPAFAKTQSIMFTKSKFKRNELPWEDEYVAAPTLKLRKRNADGSVVPTRQFAFNLGDFVDVTVTFDIVSKGDSVQIHLNLERVVLLSPVSKVREFLKAKAMNAAPHPLDPSPSSAGLIFPMGLHANVRTGHAEYTPEDAARSPVSDALVNPLLRLDVGASAPTQASPAEKEKYNPDHMEE